VVVAVDNNNNSNNRINRVPDKETSSIFSTTTDLHPESVLPSPIAKATKNNP
jgi:hypothetical protein